MEEVESAISEKCRACRQEYPTAAVSFTAANLNLSTEPSFSSVSSNSAFECPDESTDLKAAPALPSSANRHRKHRLFPADLRVGQNQVSTFRIEHGDRLHRHVAARCDACLRCDQGIAR